MLCHYPICQLLLFLKLHFSIEVWCQKESIHSMTNIWFKPPLIFVSKSNCSSIPELGLRANINESPGNTILPMEVYFTTFVRKLGHHSSFPLHNAFLSLYTTTQAHSNACFFIQIMKNECCVVTMTTSRELQCRTLILYALTIAECYWNGNKYLGFIDFQDVPDK